MALSIIVATSVGACEYLCYVFWAFVPLWIVQMITGLVPCDNHCALVLFIRGTPRAFVWVSTLFFITCLLLYTARRNLGKIKIKCYAFLRLSVRKLTYQNELQSILGIIIGLVLGRSSLE